MLIFGLNTFNYSSLIKYIGKRHEFEASVPTNVTSSSSSNYELNLREGPNSYHIATPDTPTESPHKSKIRKTQLGALRRMFHFGTPFAVDHTVAADYQASQMQQRNNLSLRTLN